MLIFNKMVIFINAHALENLQNTMESVQKRTVENVVPIKTLTRNGVRSLCIFK